MRVVAISQIPLGSLRAHAINVVKTAGGFARLGHDVTLLVQPPQDAGPRPDPAAIYAEPNLSWIVSPPGLDERAFGCWAAGKAADADLVYARNFCAPLRTALAGVPTVVETHAHVGADNPLLDQTLALTRRCPSLRAIITIAPVLRDHYIDRGADPARVHVVPDGVDVELFSRPTPSPWSTPGPHVVYAGHLYDYKGIPSILRAAAALPQITFHLVGGLPNDIARHQSTIETLRLHNTVLHGLHAHADVPAFVQHADALLLVPSALEASKDWTSPVKLGEYLAAGPPIVVSRIPALERVIPESFACWCEPDCSDSLVAAINQALSARDAHRLDRLAMTHRLSYSARASRMLEVARVRSRGAAA